SVEWSNRDLAAARESFNRRTSVGNSTASASQSNGGNRRTDSHHQSHHRNTSGGAPRQLARPALEDDPLPAGWEMRLTPTGQPYYMDHNNRRTQWVDPRSYV
ncbi:hypothetical protein SARC_00150, partial [Sphaeroforma arctica JP610]